MEYISNFYSKIYNYFYNTPDIPVPDTKKIINKVDENGLPHGLWETYYFNEKIHSKGFYDHGKKIGN